MIRDAGGRSRKAYSKMLDRSSVAFLPSQRYTLSTGDAAMNLGRFGVIDVICGK
jgi:hypothetical protein